VDQDRDQVVVGVREERVVLMPLEAGLAARRGLQVQLAVVELDVRPDHVLDGVEDPRVERGLVEQLVMLDRAEDPSDVVVAVVAAGDRELVGVFGQPLGLLQQLRNRPAELGQLGRAEHLREDQIALVLVERLLLGRRHLLGRYRHARSSLIIVSALHLREPPGPRPYDPAPDVAPALNRRTFSLAPPAARVNALD
jgi:hypothetical protein